MTPEERQELRERIVKLVVSTEGHDVAGAILLLGDELVRSLDSIDMTLADISENIKKIWKEMPAV